MKDSLMIKFLYRTVIGRLVLKLLVNPGLSKRAAKYFSSKASTKFIPGFVRKNGIELSLYKVPEGGFSSFNDFFVREKKELTVSDSKMVCPCDGLLTYSKISEDLVFNIKHTFYSVAELLGDKGLAGEFVGGTAYIFRLTPAHYHRYIFCTDGILTGKKRIEGVLHSVQPVCHEMTKVFVQNSREYAVIDSREFGKIIQMEIGALLVGKISNRVIDSGSKVVKGTEKGNFEYGGSSIVVLTKQCLDLPDAMKLRVNEGCEIPVFVGETLIEVK